MKIPFAFSQDLLFVAAQPREPGPVARGQVREKAFEGDGLWIGYCKITARDEPGEWHHHADYDSLIYLVSGRCRIDHGDRQETNTIMAIGDCGFFPEERIRRAQILGDGRCDYVYIRFGQIESVVSPHGPGTRVPTMVPQQRHAA